MGTGVDGPDVGQIMVNLGGAIRKGRRATILEAAVKAKKVHESAIRAASGGDMRLSGVNRAKGRPGNTRVGVRFDLKDGLANPTMLMKATGPLQLIENDTAGRVIRSAWSKGRSRRGFVGPTVGGQFKGGRKAVLHIPGIGFRRSARHPGTKGQHPWAKSRKVTDLVIRDSMRRATFNIIKGAAHDHS